MSKFFLNLPAWALFMLLLVAPIVLYITAVAAMMPTDAFYYPEDVDPQDMVPAMMLTMVIGVVPALLLWGGWYLSAGNALAQRLPESVKMPVSFFRTNMVIIVSLLALAGVFMIATISWMGANAPDLLAASMAGENVDFMAYGIPFPGWMTGGMVLLSFGGLYAIFAVFHSYWFMGKSLVAVERGQVTDFNDFAGPFFMFWFWFIGIWWLQPRIQAVLNKETVVHDPLSGDAEDDPFV